MAVRARDIALEGLAHDYDDPLTLATVGFASTDAAAPTGHASLLSTWVLLYCEDD